MKTILTICCALALVSAASAQTGTIRYKDTRKIEIHLDGDASEMQSMLPKERTSSHILYYTPETSLYSNEKQLDDQDVNQEIEGGGTVMIKMQEPEDQIYSDFKNQKTIEQREFMSRMFLIESANDSVPWKLTGNLKSILGFPCMEAVYVKDSIKTVAWFTSSIPVSGGPALFNGLPGMILEVNSNNGNRIISAVSVMPGDVSSFIIKPKQGKKVTKDEFNKMVEEKTGTTKGDGNAVIMIKMQR
jgi:GLPGLI family protein